MARITLRAGWVLHLALGLLGILISTHTHICNKVIMVMPNIFAYLFS
ncbi:hypothetical protein HNQ59_003292 [Chitinivorax tropicus]|uniref:Uncharacterized protein n=1 Tax=Chitinivorax tropicus TaxID=714531 RepID=A0A840MLE9_9PROT|nr:hypothetical protein [Chitinivorax tropicus]